MNEPGDELLLRVREALSRVLGPDGHSLLASGVLQGLTVRQGRANIVLDAGPSDPSLWEPVRAACEAAVKAVPGIASVTAVLTAERAAAPQPPGPPRARHAQLNAGLARETAPQPPASSQKQPLAGVGAVIAVASGKGGVGKSTVAVNLALSLAALGLSAGVLDADIYGPSVPKMLGLKGKPVSADGKRLEPMLAHGVKAMSIGLLVDQDQPMIWRGPVATAALSQLMTDVNWAPLDVLVVDMPPGTGDIQLTLAQRAPLSGAVIVSTPQDIALIDARKALAMFRRVAVPILGIVENMGVYHCPNCGHVDHIFGDGGAKATAADLKVPFLGQIPLRRVIRETGDAGVPVAADIASPEGQAFLEIARAVLQSLKAPDARPAPRLRILP